MQNDRFVIHYSKKGNALYAIGALAMSAASLLCIFVAFKSVPYPLKAVLDILLAVGFLFFGYGFFFFLRRISKNSEMLIIDRRGITDRTSAISLGFIPWEDIETAYIGGAANNRFIEVKIKNEEKSLASLPPVKKLLINANRKLGYQAVCITLNTTKCSPEDVLIVINNYSGGKAAF